MFFNIFSSLENKYKNEFSTVVNNINVSRAKATALTFIILETVMLIAAFIFRRESFFQKPAIYYEVMYALLLVVMIAYFLIFTRLKNNISEHGTSISITGICFISTILLWCAGISLLDQQSSGQIIVYTVAIVAVASTPVFQPMALLVIYLIIQVLFCAAMPYFQKSGNILSANVINSTAFIIISWSISWMRYKKQIDDFLNNKTIQEKSAELKRLNKELEEANQKLEKLSQTDSLTSISNRLVFDRSIKSEWDRCKRHRIPLSLIMIDIDFFKAYNDNYGHQAGDNCLKKVAGVLSSCARRSSDIVARYGGEEFVVILPHLDKEKALEFAEKMRSEVEHMDIPHMYSPVSQHVTISVGVHTGIPSEVSSADEYVRIADEALYKAKKLRNNVVAA